MQKNIFGWQQINKNLVVLFSLIMLSLLILMLFSIFVVQSTLSNSYLSQKAKQDRFFYWEKKVQEYPNSPDVLYNAALSAVKVNKNETALRFLNQALSQDPLFEEAISLQSEIVGKTL